uniref:SPATA31 subfamily D, member 3 n=1 Tax=Rattus norvegicus TaxID=10116 RepID=A0ABK0LFD3_RAT
MENIFSSLNGLTETWLTFGSASYHKYLSYILLSGLGLLLLYISSLIVRLLARSLQRKKYAPKLQNNIRHRRGKAFKPNHIIPQAFGNCYGQSPSVVYITKQVLWSATCSLRLPWKTVVMPLWCPLCLLGLL